MTQRDPTKGLIADDREALLDAPRPRITTRGKAKVWLGLGLLALLALVGVNWSTLTRSLSPPAQVIGNGPGSGPSLPSVMGVPHQSNPVVTKVAPRPLADCLAGDRVIDEQVLRCRFGEVPRPRADAGTQQGMVSEAYLAQYKAGSPRRPRTSSLTEPEEQVISGWDGRGRYLATWQVSGNQIDYASVCANYRSGSIDYRECRKGAKQWFKAQCRLTKRWDALSLQRYCSAASGFSPMG